MIKKIVSVVALVCLCCVLLCGCVEKAPEPDVADKLGAELYTMALAISDREGYEFEAYDFGLLKKYQQNDIFYYRVTNFFDHDLSLMSDDSLVKLKENLGLLLTAEKTAFVPIEYEPTLFTGKYSLFVEELTVDRIVFKVYTVSYASAEERDSGSPASITNTSDFVLARSFKDVENEDGKTVREYYWYILDYTSPY